MGSIASQQTLPREKLLASGPESLSDKELLSIILGSGQKGRDVFTVARDLLKKMDDLSSPYALKELIQVKGIGETKAAQLCAALEFSRRRLCPPGNKISFPEDIIPVISHLADRNRETFIVISLNGAHEVINKRIVSIGTVNKTLVHPREVFTGPITDHSAAIIAAHNHPSGNLDPSPQDKEITKRLSSAGEILGIPLLDHVIFSNSGYISFLEKKLI